MPGGSQFVTICGLDIWNPDYKGFRDWFFAAVRDQAPVQLGIVNAHSVNLALDRPEFKEVLASMDRLINDGAGMAMAAKARGTPFLYNFNGTDLFPRLFAEVPEPVKLFLFGASEVSNEGAAKEISSRYPKIEIVGRRDGFSSRQGLTEEILNSRAQLLLVALGQPAQELWIAENAKNLPLLSCGVGALFDFLSGNIPRAPAWMRKAKSEWIYRLAREPRRMFTRYVTGNPRFLRRCKLWLERDLAVIRARAE